MSHFTVTLVFGQTTPIPRNAVSSFTIVTINVPVGAVVIWVQDAKLAFDIAAAEQAMEKIIRILNRLQSMAFPPLIDVLENGGWVQVEEADDNGLGIVVSVKEEEAGVWHVGHVHVHEGHVKILLNIGLPMASVLEPPVNSIRKTYLKPSLTFT